MRRSRSGHMCQLLLTSTGPSSSCWSRSSSTAALAARDPLLACHRRGGTPRIGRNACERLLSEAGAFSLSPLTTLSERFGALAYRRTGCALYRLESTLRIFGRSTSAHESGWRCSDVGSLTSRSAGTKVADQAAFDTQLRTCQLSSIRPRCVRCCCTSDGLPLSSDCRFYSARTPESGPN